MTRGFKTYSTPPPFDDVCISKCKYIRNSTLHWGNNHYTRAESTVLTAYRWCFVAACNPPCPYRLPNARRTLAMRQQKMPRWKCVVSASHVSWSVVSSRGLMLGSWDRDLSDTGLWSQFSNTRVRSKVAILRLVIMTLGYRDLVSSGLYRYDPIVTDFTFATTLVTLFGPQVSLFIFLKPKLVKT